MKKIKTPSKLLMVVLILGAACTGCTSKQNKAELLPLLKKPASVSEEVWLKDWANKIVVNASLKKDDTYLYPNHYPTYVVRFSIKNKTDHRLVTGSNLYLIETAKQSQENKPTTDLLEVIGGYFNQPPLEDYAGVVETRGEPLTDYVKMGLIDWVTTENRGGFYDFTRLFVHSAGFRSKYPTALNFGEALSGDSLAIETEELQLSVKMKPEQLANIFVVTPLLKFGTNSEAQFRYILRFENGDRLAETILLPMSETALGHIVADSSEYLWKRVFAASWAGHHLGMNAGQILLPALQAPSAALKKAALHGIGVSKYTAAFDNVLKIAQDQEGHPSLRLAAINTLGQLADNRSTSFLLSIATNKKSNFRETAFQALATLNDPVAQEPILKLIENGNLPSENVSLPLFDTLMLGRLQIAATSRKANKNAALGAIAKIGTSHAIEILAELYSKSDIKVRVQICDALMGINSPGAETILITALQESDQTLLFYALNSLASIKSPTRTKILVGLLSSPDPQSVMTAIRKLSEASIEEAKPQILILLNDHTLKPDIRRVAAEALVYYPGDESIEALINLLTDTVTELKIGAAKTLEKIPGKKQIPALTIALNDPEMLVRLYSARALASHSGQSSCQPILDALLKESDGECAETMADCLIQIPCNDPKLAAPLINLINSTDKRLRGAIGKYISFASGKLFETGYDASPATLTEAIKVWAEWSKGIK